VETTLDVFREEPLPAADRFWRREDHDPRRTRRHARCGTTSTRSAGKILQLYSGMPIVSVAGVVDPKGY
jgi:hypothetical protein